MKLSKKLEKGPAAFLAAQKDVESIVEPGFLKKKN